MRPLCSFATAIFILILIESRQADGEATPARHLPVLVSKSATGLINILAEQDEGNAAGPRSWPSLVSHLTTYDHRGLNHTSLHAALQHTSPPPLVPSLSLEPVFAHFIHSWISSPEVVFSSWSQHNFFLSGPNLSLLATSLLAAVIGERKGHL